MRQRSVKGADFNHIIQDRAVYQRAVTYTSPVPATSVDHMVDGEGHAPYLLNWEATVAATAYVLFCHPTHASEEMFFFSDVHRLHRARGGAHAPTFTNAWERGTMNRTLENSKQ